MPKITVTPMPITATIIRNPATGTWSFRDDQMHRYCESNNFARREYAVNAALRMGFTKVV